MLDDFSLVLMLHSMNVYFATVSYKQHSFNFQTLQKLPGIANAISYSNKSLSSCTMYIHVIQKVTFLEFQSYTGV